MTKDPSLIKSSFSRVGLSLPINGSKDHLIKIQAAEFLKFEPVSFSIDDEKEQDQLVKIESPAPILPSPPKRKRRSIEIVFADPPENTVEEEAFERFEDWYYRIEKVMIEFRNDVLGCEEKFFGEDSGSEDFLSDEMNLGQRIESAHESLDILNEVISETKHEVSQELPFERFSLVAAVLMFADPTPDGITELKERLEYITTRYW